MVSKQDEVKKALAGIVGGKPEPEPESGTEEKKSSGYKVVSVGLTADELAKVEAIADELGQNRHAILKYAVTEFIRDYKAGERPEYKTIRVLDTST